MKLFVFFEEGDEWAFHVRVNGGVPVEDDVAEEKFSEVGPAATGKAMSVDGVSGRDAVECKFLEVWTAGDEHLPETFVALYRVLWRPKVSTQTYVEGSDMFVSFEMSDDCESLTYLARAPNVERRNWT